MSSIQWDLVKEIAKPVISLIIGGILTHFFEKKSRVITYLGHVSGIKLSSTTNPIIVNSHSIVLRNNGRKAATDIRLGHNTLPDFQVFPDIQYEVKDLPGGQKEIIIPKLIPKKEITITYLYFPPTTWNQVNTHIESDDGPIQVVRILPTIQIPNWIKFILWFLLTYGAIALIYSLYELYLHYF
ncbi:TPA: hypothetical protein ACMGHP_002616 [Legionella pneumophila]|nr:hypothetical protein [Legionella pneumophila]HCX3330765.1 hypothetical protein [Legionella pneumophila]